MLVIVNMGEWGAGRCGGRVPWLSGGFEGCFGYVRVRRDAAVTLCYGRARGREKMYWAVVVGLLYVYCHGSAGHPSLSASRVGARRSPFGCDGGCGNWSCGRWCDALGGLPTVGSVDGAG